MTILNMKQKEQVNEMTNKYVDITHLNETSLEYSDDPETLKELLQDIKVSIKFKKTDKYFADDTDYRDILSIKIERDDTKIIFDFGCSINDTQMNKNSNVYHYISSNMLCTILSSCLFDYYIPEDFSDFVDEYGYDVELEGTTKIRNLHERCLKQSEKIKSIFSEDEIVCLPN
jgi:hypothetical protein